MLISCFCTKKKWHIVEQENINECNNCSFIIYIGKKRRDKKEITKTAFCSFSLSSFCCLLVYSSILSADIATASTATIRDDCQVVLSIENYMVNHRSWDMYILGAEERKERKEKRGWNRLAIHAYIRVYIHILFHPLSIQLRI